MKKLFLVSIVLLGLREWYLDGTYLIPFGSFGSYSIGSSTINSYFANSTITTLTASKITDFQGNNFATSTTAGSGTVATTTPWTAGNIVVASSSNLITTTSTIFLTTSTNLGTSNFASANISQWTNNSGYITTSTGLVVANFSSPNISQWTNNSGYLTTSTGLVVANFASPNLSLWTNNLNWIATSTYNASITISTALPLGGGTQLSNNSTVALTCSTCLITSNNLSDLTSTSSARTNIGYSAGSNVAISGTGVISVSMQSGLLVGGCSGAFPSSATIFMPLGVPTSTCSGTTETTSTSPAVNAATWKNLFVNCVTAFKSASKGVVTVDKNKVATAVTCTVGTSATATCSDTTHSFTTAANDQLTVSVLTGTSETGASCYLSLEEWKP